MSSQLNLPAAFSDGSDLSERGPALPETYGVTRLAIMPRDPEWLHVCWDVAPYTWVEVERIYGPEARVEGKPVLRFFLGENGTSRGFDAGVQLDARNCYVRLPQGPGRCRGELGVLLPDGRFGLLAISNEAWMAAGRPSDLGKERWETFEKKRESLYELSGGGRMGAGSSNMGRYQREEAGASA